jgi:photosystem II stability/assembly factor-like uncharacterized protein
MTNTPSDDTIRDRLHQAIDPARPDAAAEDRVLRAVRRQSFDGPTRRPVTRRLGAFAGAVGLFVVFAGALGLALELSHQSAPIVAPGPHPAASPPGVISPAPTSTLPVPTATACQGTSCSLPSPSAARTASLLDLTWISDQQGWALTVSSCGQASCAALFSTADGGLTWQRLADPPVTSASGQTTCQPATCVARVRFATPTIGYLYGPALFMTTDAGRTWQQQSSAGVEALEPSGGSVYRLVYDHGGCPGPCNRTLWKAAVGSTTWHQVYSLPSPPSRGVTAALVVLDGGQTVYATIYGDLAAGAGTQQAVIYRSLDGGATWKTLADPCGSSGASLAVDLDATGNGFAAALCAPRGAGTASQSVVTSNDSGSTWGAPHPVPGSFMGLIAAATPTHLAIASPPSSGSGPATASLFVSTDGGLHWSAAGTESATLDASHPLPAFLGFESATSGRWIGAGNAIWTTEDGGSHWTRRAFPGP